MAPECATTFIPPHKHVVTLGLTHLELNASYGLGHGTKFTLRMPYDVKAMHVRYTTLTGEPFVPPYGDIHHRTETLVGPATPPGPEIVKLTELGLKVNDCARAVSG